jgi:hypothetical protein
MKTRKYRRLPGGQKQRLRASRTNEVWAVDFQFDETSDRRRIKLCNIVDEFTREAVAIASADLAPPMTWWKSSLASSPNAGLLPFCAQTMARSSSRGHYATTADAYVHKLHRARLTLGEPLP